MLLLGRVAIRVLKSGFLGGEKGVAIRALLSLFISKYNHDRVAVRELKSNNFEGKKCVAIRGCCY